MSATTRTPVFKTRPSLNTVVFLSETPPFLGSLPQAIEAQGQHAPQWVNDARQQAFERFSALGFPSRRHEAFQQIDLKPIASQSLALWPEQVSVAELTQNITPPADLPPNTQVFVNGQLAPVWSGKRPNWPDAVFVGDLATAWHTPDVSEKLQNSWSRFTDSETDPFALLNTMLVSGGAVVSVPDDTTVTMPVNLAFSTLIPPQATEALGLLTRMPRLTILAGKNSKVTVYVHFMGEWSAQVSPDSQQLLINRHVQVLAEAHAQVSVVLVHHHVERTTQFTSTLLACDAASEVSVLTLKFGNTPHPGASAPVRNHVRAMLLGEKAHCTLNALSLLSGNSQVYHHTVIQHAVPHTTSSQLYKTILEDTARAEFNGTIQVNAGALKTDASQLCKTLLLSDEARMFTRPQLQIDADDVKCAHGATIGQLDETAMFYLQTRGVSQADARAMLTYGFALDMLDRLPTTTLKTQLGLEVAKALGCEAMAQDLALACSHAIARRID